MSSSIISLHIILRKHFFLRRNLLRVHHPLRATSPRASLCVHHPLRASPVCFDLPFDDSDFVFSFSVFKISAPEHWRLIKAHGKSAGLPTEDYLGNSEVGHNALGAGCLYARVHYPAEALNTISFSESKSQLLEVQLLMDAE